MTKPSARRTKKGPRQRRGDPPKYRLRDTFNERGRRAAKASAPELGVKASSVDAWSRDWRRGFWSTLEAKNRFGALVEAAQREPQTVTRHGKPTAVVISAEEHAGLTRLQSSRKKPSFVRRLLDIPQGGDEDLFERVSIRAREVEL
jgi:prevent-host-death family protein